MGPRPTPRQGEGARKRAPENRAGRREAPNLPRPRRTENRTPDKRATSEIVVQRESQTSKHPSFQTSTLPCTRKHVCNVPRGSPVGRIGPIGHIGRGSPFPKAWRAKPAMLPQAPGPDVRLARTHGPPLASLSLRVLSHGRFGPLGLHGNFQSIWQSAGGSRPLIGSNRRNRRSPLSVFVHLRGPSCSSCQPRRVNLPHSPCALTRRPLVGRSVLRSPFSVLRAR